MLHDLVIWPNAHGFAETILGDLRLSFDVLSITTVHWDEDKWYDNIRVFYSQSWQGLPLFKLQKAVHEKAEYCGKGPLILVIFEDPTPEMTNEQTTEGRSEVNARVFNKKKEYRNLTGGGHLVHTSNNAKETDRDLALLLGVGADDYMERREANNTEMSKVFRNCAGIDGFDSLESLFYTLNHAIDYCVLRNFECLPDRFFEQGHEDIDLLVENLSQMILLTSAKPISGERGRVDYSIRVNGKNVPFDFRHIGDNYYDMAWERHILNNKKQQRGFYIPGDEDLYYSLLYHAYIQKHQVKPDYYSKLEGYGSAIGVPFSHDVQATILQLDTFMKDRGYEYIVPKDKTVVYNLHNLDYSAYAFRNGPCIKHTDEIGSNGFIYSSKVFQGNDVMIKTGTTWLLKSEAASLEKLSQYAYFPRVISKQTLGNGQTCLMLSKVKGVGFDVFFKNVTNQHPQHVRSFVKQMVDILLILKSNGINHRDISPSNIIVCRDNKKVRVSLIDFGWAIYRESKDVKTPLYLGGRYSDGDNHSDCYAVGVLFMDYWPDLFGMRWLSSALFKAANSETDALLKKARRISKLPMGLYDRFRLLLRRHQRISIIWHRLCK